MKRKTKRKIILVFVSIVALFLVVVGLFVYTVLGPFRGLFWNTPTMMGFLGPRTYLVLLQNNNELRPTGGFITAVAKVTTLFGYPSIEVMDSYQVPDPKPPLPAPEPFEYFIGSHDPFFAGWTFRDANFSPDFSKSSQDVIELYRSAYPQESIDGVFSLDFAVIEKLLEDYGPILVEDVTFTKDNFFSNTQRISKNIDTHDVEQLKSRKNILKPFVSTLVKTIASKPFSYHQLSQSMARLGVEKHILAYSTSESLQQKFQSLGMTGMLPAVQPNSDFLHVNIANIGGRKADRYITKDINYLADFSNPEQHESRLDITLEHLGSYNIQSDIYQAYIRIYTPLGSNLQSATGDRLRATQESGDLGYSVFADVIRMKPGDKISLSYRYKLPDTIDPLDYRLRIVQQPGSQNTEWRVAVKEMNDSTLENQPDEFQDNTPLLIRENLGLWDGELQYDRFFHIRQTADTLGPVILWQEFEGLTEINIRVNELLDTTTVLESGNYTLIDLDVADPQHDSLSITSVRFQDRDIWLKIGGATLQPEEHYGLTIKDLKDVSGNISEPNPLERTVVQRIVTP